MHSPPAVLLYFTYWNVLHMALILINMNALPAFPIVTLINIPVMLPAVAE